MNGNAQENGNSKDNTPAIQTNTANSQVTKGNEDKKKIFVGGITYDTTNDDLTSHFSQFGEVASAQVKFDRATGRSRGFAFVEFVNSESCKTALAAREQSIKNKNVEVKPAKSRENKKVFVGGLPSDYEETLLREHFEAFGKVEDIEWPFDKQTKMHRNFAFIVFDEEESADKASAQPKQNFGTRECDVKKAVPQSRRFGLPRVSMGRFGGRGAPGWYGGWGQVATVPYGNGWNGEWYNATAFYGGGQNNAYSSYAATGNNYEYQGSSRNNNSSQRFQQPASAQHY